MRILQLTAGTGSFHCGMCVRDRALVLALRRRGHDVAMLPLYLPLVLDGAEEGAADIGPLFFGGVNAYLQQKSSFFRHTPRWVDRLLDAPVLLRLAGRRTGMTDGHVLGEMTLSMLAGEAGHQKKELDKLIDYLRLQPRFDVVSLSTVLLVGMARQLRAELGVPVVCGLQGEDTFLDALPEPHRAAAWQLLGERARDAQAFIALSKYYAQLMTGRLAIPGNRLHVVYPGLDLGQYPPVPPGAGAGAVTPAVGFLARMTPPKGLHLLVDAFVLLKQRNRVPGLRLSVAGAQPLADESYVRDQQKKLAKAGVAGDVEFLPNITHETKVRFLQRLSVLCVPAMYPEAFGLYALEAMAMGVPVLEPRRGAFPELLEATSGGVLCAPDDPRILAEALEALLLDPARAQRLGKAGRAAVAARFTVDQMAEQVLKVFAGAGKEATPGYRGSSPPEVLTATRAGGG